MLGAKASTDNVKIETWKFTVNTEATAEGEKKTGVPFNLSKLTDVEFTVDWGDGTESVLVPALYTPADSRASMHEYENAGIYQISITGDSRSWKKTYLMQLLNVATSTSNSIDPIWWWTRTLISVDNPFPKMYGVVTYNNSSSTDFNAGYGFQKIFNNCFQGCKNLTTIPSGLFDNNTTITDFTWCFYNCSSLQSIPDGLFNKHSEVSTFNSCFELCTSIESIPNGLFDNNTKVTSFLECFCRCTSLKSIPAGLFDNNTKVTAFAYCFADCFSLKSIPAGLFDNNTEATNFSDCFVGDYNIRSIPSGLFDHNTEVTSFSECFRTCTSLKSIPEGLFDNNTKVTSFSYCFSRCYNLSYIPLGLFDYNTEVTNFSGVFGSNTGMYYTYGNSSPDDIITGKKNIKLTHISSDLFKYNTKATNFSYAFATCAALSDIPVGLFDNNTAATNFQYCFFDCSSLQSIPAGLFDNNTAATSFSYCFDGCSSLQSIPSKLFDKNTAATNFSYCFDGCSSLQSIPAGLFVKNTAATNFSQCFYGCSSLNNFKLIIGSSAVSNFSSFVATTSNVTRIVCVPANSTTYTTLSSYAQIGSYKNNITVSTHNLDCVRTFEYTVDTEATTAGAKVAAIPIAALQNASSKLMIDWGDGIGVELESEDVITANLTHTYSTADEYQITVGTINWLDYQFLADSSASSSNTLIQTFRETVTSIDSSMPSISNTTLDYFFYNCIHLESYPSRIFDNLPNVTSAISTFEGCSSLIDISAGTLRNQTQVTNASSLFKGCILPTYVPSGLLSQCKQLTNISNIFNGCTNLAAIPNTLLLNNTAITNQTNAFAGCSNSSPTFLTKAQFEANGYFIELYDTEVSEENGSIASIPFTLYGQSGSLTIDWGDGNTASLTSSNYTNSDATASSHQFSNIGLYFIAVQSSNWNNACPCGNTTYNFDGYLLKNYSNGNAHIFYRSKTLIEVPIKLPTFNSINAVRNYDTSTGIVSYNKTSNSLCSFYECCKKLKLICNNLFENHSNVTNFSSCFSFCHSLQLVPTGLFNNCTAVTDFSCCFYRCYSMQSIPAGLFDSCTAVTNFASCFYNCYSMQSIPAGLFDSCTAVIYFGSCFNGCSSIASIPAGLFDNNTAATSFYSCFAYNSITSIPSGLFDNNTAVTDFKGCFAQCKKLSTIPNDLFKYNVNVTQISTTSSNSDMHLFEECISLKSIPEHLFDSFTNVTLFNKCFYGCSSLQSIPSGLFVNNTAVTSFSNCFYYCSALNDFTLTIGSSLVSSASSFVTKKTGTTRTLYVPESSTTYTTFNNLASTLGLAIVAQPSE